MIYREVNRGAGKPYPYAIDRDVRIGGKIMEVIQFVLNEKGEKIAVMVDLRIVTRIGRRSPPRSPINKFRAFPLYQ